MSGGRWHRGAVVGNASKSHVPHWSKISTDGAMVLATMDLLLMSFHELLVLYLGCMLFIFVLCCALSTSNDSRCS